MIGIDEEQISCALFQVVHMPFKTFGLLRLYRHTIQSVMRTISHSFSKSFMPKNISTIISTENKIRNEMGTQTHDLRHHSSQPKALSKNATTL